MEITTTPKLLPSDTTPSGLKRILCPTDFSRIGENAVTYAAELAKHTGANLHLMHANLLSDLTPEEALVSSGAHLTDMLKKESLEITNSFKISCTYQTVTSTKSLAKGIARVAKDFDLIVMGTNGEDDFFQRLFGSTTFRVIKKTGVPVIVVPEQCSYAPIRHIAYAFDYWRVLDVPMDKLVELSKALGCEVTLVQVMEAFSHDAEKELRDTEAFLKEKYLGQLKLSFKTLYDPNVTHALREFMLKGDYDALALFLMEGIGAHLHTRVIREMTGDIWYPLIAIH
jgi:nucleotide-binding universal stress UspA family protein